MCLKFLLEGNKENQGIVRELEARSVVETQEVERLRGMGMDVGVEGGKVRVSRPAGAGTGMPLRRASEGNARLGSARYRESQRIKEIDVDDAEDQEGDRVLGEDVGNL